MSTPSWHHPDPGPNSPDTTTGPAPGQVPRPPAPPPPVMAVCGLCPEPGLVPAQQLTDHLDKVHPGRAFKCGACKVALLDYPSMEVHMKEAHGVENTVQVPDMIPSSVKPPKHKYLFKFFCGACNKSKQRLWLTARDALAHIDEQHSQYFRRSLRAACRLCGVSSEDDDVESFAAGHANICTLVGKFTFNTTLNSNHGADENIDANNVNAAKTKASSKVKNPGVKFSIRKDLYSKDTNTHIKKEKEEESSDIEIVEEKLNFDLSLVKKQVKSTSVEDGEVKSPKNIKENRKNARRRAREDSSSSSPSPLKPKEQQQSRRAKKIRTKAKRKESSSSSSSSTSRSSSSSSESSRSPSSNRRRLKGEGKSSRKGRSKLKKIRRESSQESQENVTKSLGKCSSKFPKSLPKSYVNYAQRVFRSPSQSQSPARKYGCRPESPLTRKYGSKSRSPRRFSRSRSHSQPRGLGRRRSPLTRKYGSRSPPTRSRYENWRGSRSRSPPPSSYNRPPPSGTRRYGSRSRSPPPHHHRTWSFQPWPKTRENRSNHQYPQYHHAKSDYSNPDHPAHRLMSPERRKQSPGRWHARKRMSPSPSRSRNPSNPDPYPGQQIVQDTPFFTEFGSGQIRCKVCAEICISWSQFIDHKQGAIHQDKVRGQKKEPRGEPEKESLKGKKEEHVNIQEAQFGKIFCKHCKKAFIEKHYHCEICQIICTSEGNLAQHNAGKAHAEKVKLATDAVQKTKPPAEPSADINTSSSQCRSQSNRLLFCHAQGCYATFANEIQLKRHIRSLHGYLIKCTECVAMKQTPAEVLTCEELINHYDDAHNKVMKVYDLKFFGDVKNWKQGYVKCKLCDTKLGSPGLWFTNELNMSVIGAHFEDKHPHCKQIPRQRQITLGCQLCLFKVEGSACYSWLNHLSTHAPDDNRDNAQTSSTGSSSGMVTSPCVFCGEKVVKSGNAEQKHIETQHQDLAFQCKLCVPADRYYYTRREQVLDHLRLKHFGQDVVKDENIKYPGDRNSLLGFAWIKCKNCEFSGVGLGEDLIQHQVKAHYGGGIKFFNIFCRLCHKDDRVVDVLETAEEFKDHMKVKHSELLKKLPTVM